jgi:HemY protein
VRLLISSLIALLLAVGAGVFLSRDTGRVVFTFGEWTVQSSLSLFILVLFIVLVLSYFLLRFISGMIHMPRNIERWRQHRRYRKSEYFLTHGLLSLVEGDWRGAEKAFNKGVRYSRFPLLNYLFAAKAAQQQGEVQRRDHYLRLAHEHGADSDVAVGLTQAELQLDQHQTEMAYATLHHLAGERRGGDQAKLMMLEASSELKDWQQSLELLRDLEKKNVLPLERIRAKQLQVYAGLLRNTGESGKREQLEEEWRAIPKKLRSEFYLIEVYVNERLRFDDTRDCEELLRGVLKKKWDSALVRLYGLVEGESADKQLRFAERLHPTHARDAVLLLTLGRLAKRNGLWGKARSYLEESLQVHPYPETYHELATLLVQEGDNAAAARCFQDGLALATYSVPGARRRLEDKQDKQDKQQTEKSEG